MLIHDQVREAIDSLEIPFGELGIDAYGTSKNHLRTALTALGFLYRHYFTVETRGIEHVPARGRAMLVGNHSGGIAIDAAMIIAACALEMSPPRLAQTMTDRFLARMPLLGTWTSRMGQLTGLPQHAERLLADERLVLVFPEGTRGTAKLYRERHSLVDFGTGFMRLALRTQTPIIPVAVLGGSEAFPTVRNSYSLGRYLGVPYIPLVAYGLPVPFPAKIEIQFGAPIRPSADSHDDNSVIRAHVDEVKAAIAQMVQAGARRRRGVVPDAGSLGPEGSGLGESP
ncbi:MAG: lysophospholipid acyltransferase family protein [Polyangiaceae bacterium]